MKTYINIIVAVVILSSCKAPLIQTITTPCKYGQIDILSIEQRKTEKVVLFVPDDDTVDIDKQIAFFIPLLGKRTSLYTFPKYKYQNVTEKDNADNPDLRIELLVEAYQSLVKSGKITETQEVVVLGLGEGSLVAPHFSRLITSNKLLLINPLYHSYRENITLAYSEKTKNAKDLRAYIGFRYQNEWLSFFEDVENRVKPDKTAGNRTYRYYSSYWHYYPGKYIGTQKPTEFIIFKEYYLSSETEKNFILNLEEPNMNSTLIEGYMFSKFSATEIKKLDWF